MIDIDISRLTPQERLDLIARLWESLDMNDVPLTPAQGAELDRRLVTADADLADSVPWDVLRAEFADRLK
jgi:putative addiction module component (TIGR02574 family)